MGVYLVTNKPARSQFREGRRATPTGCTVLHTAESVLDTVGPDTGAENVAAFIARRSEPGSYHDLVDSDTALQLVRYADEAYHDGTGSNRFALSISWALRTSDWAKLTPERRAAFLGQGARAFARQQAWLAANRYPLTPLRRITKAQSDAGEAGFITHADRDPANRSDPGRDFPWAEWFTACRNAITPPEDDMPTLEQITAAVKAAMPNPWAYSFGRGDSRKTAGQLLGETRRDSAAALAAVRELAKQTPGVDELVIDRIAKEAAARIDIDVTVNPKES